MNHLQHLYLNVLDFFARPATHKRLGIFRICVAVISILYIAVIWKDILYIYGEQGLIAGEINEAFSYPFLRLPRIISFLQAYGWNEVSALYFFFGCYIFCLVLLAFGICTRITAGVAWIMNLCMVNTSPTLMYGYDTFTSNCLFYCFLFPAGHAYSMDNLFLKRKNRKIYTCGIFYQRVLQLHMCIIYFFSGVNKAVSEQWWNGEALWRAINQPPLRVFDFDFLANAPWLFAAGGIMTLVIEMGYPVFIWIPKTKRFWFIAIIGLHISISILMGLYLFAAIMIVMNCTAFGKLHWLRPLAVAPSRFFYKPAKRRDMPPVLAEPQAIC
jgi:hypothetical protein